MRLRQQRQGGTIPAGNKKNRCLSKYNVSPLHECRREEFRPAFGAASVSGSLTVEASLVLSLFIFTVVMLAAPVEMLDTHRKVQMVLESAAREMAADVLLLQGGGEEEEAGGEAGAGAGPETERSGLFTAFLAGAADVYLYGRIMDMTEGRIEHLNLSRTRISADGGTIDLRASYRARLPFPFLGVRSIPFTARCLRRGWIGKRGGGADGGSEAEEMVYVGRDGSRYHRSPSCHYISNSIRVITAGSAGTARNGENRTYTPCSVCGNAESDVYYVLPEGEHYHSRPDCSSLSYYVRMVPLSSVEHLGPCSYCGGGS